jgi:hypothetical protein
MDPDQPPDYRTSITSRYRVPAKPTILEAFPKKSDLESEIKKLRAVSKKAFASANRMSVHTFLGAVFDQVSKWQAENRLEEGLYGLLDALQAPVPLRVGEPFAVMIFCTAPHIDEKSRSKWSRVLRHAAGHKSGAESLEKFIKRKGGINACAAEYAREARSCTEG